MKKHIIRLFKNLLPPSFLLWIKNGIRKLLFLTQKHGQIILIVGIAFLISDLLVIKSHNFLLADNNLPPIRLSRQSSVSGSSVSDYNNLWENNIFHTGPIPQQLEEPPSNAEPEKSSLPFKLKGTIIHANPNRSVATIDGGLKNKTSSYQVGDVIENQAEIRHIQRGKVIIFNQNNNRLEYIELPEEKYSLDISYQEDKPQVEDRGIVKKTGGNSFQVNRSDVYSHLQKLPEILNQAKVVPHYEDGKIIGWRFSSVDKGSVIESLGFSKGHIIREVDGETITSPEKAIELYERLKSRSAVKILVEKNGKEVYYEYNVNEDAPIN